MRDESQAVAGHLTGKWRFDCVHCGTVHQQATTIRRCADRFVETVIRGHVNLGSSDMFRVGNQFEAARKGLLERHAEVATLVRQVQSKHFGLDPELFCRVENQQEATKLVFDELKKFVDACSREFDPIFAEVDKFRQELEAAPLLVLGNRVKIAMLKPSGQSWRQASAVTVKIDGQEIEERAIRTYYAMQIDNSVARRRLLDGWLDLNHLDVDRSKAMFSRYDRFLGIRPIRVGKLEGKPFKDKAEMDAWFEESDREMAYEQRRRESC